MKVNKLDKIITEQLRCLVNEAEMNSREDFEKRAAIAKEREGDKINRADSDRVRKFLNNPYINVSKVVEKATGLDPTSASSEGSKFASGERDISENLANVVFTILQQLGNI